MKDALSTHLSRRNVLMAAGGAAAAAALPRPAAGTELKTDQGIGLQLYSVRKDCKKDFDAALEQVAKMGYAGVEFAGYYRYGKDAKGLKKRLDDLGLKAAGTHIRTNTLQGDALKKTIDFHKTIGCEYLIVPGDGRFCKEDKSKELAEIFNTAAAVLKPEGLYCGYHNHAREMKNAAGDKTWWDLFAERTSKDVMLQQDVGWTAHAGKDPVTFVRKYPGRTRTTHFKAHAEKGTKPFVGRDSIDWRAVITACREVGCTDWFTIEQEKYPDGKSPMECCAISLKGLKKILAEM